MTIRTCLHHSQAPLRLAVFCRYLLQEHRDQIDLSIGEKDGYTPMHGAGFQGRAGIGRLLIRAGLNPSDRHQVRHQPAAWSVCVWLGGGVLLYCCSYACCCTLLSIQRKTHRRNATEGR